MCFVVGFLLAIETRHKHHNTFVMNVIPFCPEAKLLGSCERTVLWDGQVSTQAIYYHNKQTMSHRSGWMNVTLKMSKIIMSHGAFLFQATATIVFLKTDTFVRQCMWGVMVSGLKWLKCKNQKIDFIYLNNFITNVNIF